MGKHVHLSMRMPHIEIQISCHEHRFKHLNLQYIYPISYKIAKKGKPQKMDLPLLKTISQLKLNPCY